MVSIRVDNTFGEIGIIDVKEGHTLKLSDKKIRKKLNHYKNSGESIDVESKTPNKRREYERYQIKERLRKKLEARASQNT